MEKLVKSKDEWKDKVIIGLTPSQFQDLCYEILKRNNFQNVKPRGKGSDGGRDIEAEFVQNIGKEKITQKIWLQAKRYGKTPLNYKEFNSELDKADNRGIDRFIVISNKDMTSDAKSEIQIWNQKHKCQVSDWTGTLFLDLLFECPDLCQIYFPEETIPKINNLDNPQEIISLSKNLGNRFGIEISIDSKDINIKNPLEVGEKLKQVLLGLNIDINLKALIYEKSSLFFFSINQSEKAIFFLDKSLEITPKNVDALLLKGYILEQLDKVEDSINIYEEILKIDPRNIAALNNKGHNLMRKGELEEALEYFERALSVEPKFIISIKNKVTVLKKLRRLKDARKFLEENKEFFDKSIDLITEIVDIYIEELDLRKAFEINEEILIKDPNNIIALNNKGAIYERNARFQFMNKYYPLALDCFEKVINLKRDFALGWTNKFAVLLRRENFRDAEQFMNDVSDDLSRDSEFLNSKGILFLREGKIKDAQKQFSLALKKSYKGSVLLNLANTKFILRDYEGCLSDLDRVLKYEQDNSLAWELKASCLSKLRRGNYKKCLENAEKFKLKPISLLE